MKKLTKSAHNRQIAGVCGGLGEYLGIDPIIIRIIFLIALFTGGSGFLLYIILAVVMPEEGQMSNFTNNNQPRYNRNEQPRYNREHKEQNDNDEWSDF